MLLLYHASPVRIAFADVCFRPEKSRSLIVLFATLAMGLATTVRTAQAQGLVPPTPEVASMQQRLDQLEHSNQVIMKQLEGVQVENESLTNELKALHSTLDKRVENMARTYTRRELDQIQPSDIRTDEPLDDLRDLDGDANPFEKALVWSSDDDEWTLQIHNETQLDIRAYGQHDSDPVNQFGFYIPRMRLIFNGRLTKPIEYNVSLNKGMGSLDLLDAYLNFDYDSRLQFRFGRYRVPFTYDWYALSNQFLASPERSVFALNLGLNRNTAAMLHGEIFNDHVDYAVALTCGPRNSFYDTNSSKDFLGYLNVRLFHGNSNWPMLRHLNLGGSVDFGQQGQTAQPLAFRTSASATSSSGTEQATPSFLRLNSNVTEKGTRAQWEAHLAYYYKQLTIQAAIDGGSYDYGFNNTPGTVEVNAKAWHAQFGYFLTGEEITRRTFVEVLRPFDLRAGKRGPGAIEIQARYDHFALGRSVFTGGLADAALWTNRVNTLDCGFNWYLNRYVRIAFDWQRSMYGNPVQYAPGRTSDHSDLFWIRFQNYF